MVEMTLATEPTCYDEQTGELVLKIRGSSRNGQIVRLRSSKCTIGSGLDCTLRLVAPGIQPVHCLVIRGPHATVVRSWATDTRLNGRRFHDATVRPGDLLGIGAFEFEVLAGDDSQEPAELWNETSQSPPRDEVDQLARMRSAADEETRHLQQELILQRREELQSLAASLQEQEKSLLEQSDLVKRTRMAFGTGDTPGHSSDAPDHPDGKPHSESADLAAQLHTRAAELDSCREAFRQEQHHWEEQRLMAQREIEHRIERLELDRETLEEQRRAFDKDFTDWQAACGHATDELRKRSEELDRCWQDLERQQRKHQTDQGVWDMPGDPTPDFGGDLATPIPTHAQSEEPPTEEPAPEISLSSVDVCRDLGMSVDFAEEEPIGPDEAGAPLESDCEEHSSTVDHYQEEEDEESIEDYMAKLLGRVHDSSSDSGTHSESAAEHPIDTAPDDRVTIPSPVVEPGEQARHVQVLDSAPTESCAMATEEGEDSEVPCELADISTVAAIDRDPIRRASSDATREILVAMVGLVFGSVAIWAWSVQSSTTSFLVLAVAGYTVAAYGTMRYLASEALPISRKSHAQCVEQDAASSRLSDLEDR